MDHLPAPTQPSYMPFPMYQQPLQYQSSPCYPQQPVFQQAPYPAFNGNHYGTPPPWTSRRGGYGNRGGRGNGRMNKPYNHNKHNSQTKGPEEEEKSKDFHCEPCERDFQTEEHLNAHLKSHTKCEHKGCSFIASRKALKLHEIQYHAPGRFRIKLDTPEEIAKWREERKRNYPTTGNVARKYQKLEEQRQNGQVLTKKNFRYKGHGPNRHGKDQWNVTSDSKNTQIHNSPVNKGMDRGTPTHTPSDQEEDPLSILLRKTGEDSDQEVHHDKKGENKEQTSALSSLCAYGGDSSEEEGEIKDEPVDENRNVTLPNVHSNAMTPEPIENKKVVHQPRRKGKQSDSHSKKRRPTLLEMLLAPDICRERNIMLQCIRHIKRNDFFGVKPSQTL